MNQKRLLKALKYIASVSFAGTILYLLFKNQDLAKLIDELQKVDGKWVILSMIFGGWAIVNRGLRWVVLIDALGYKSSKWNSVSAVAVLYFTNLFIPRAGEVSRCTALSQVEKIPLNKLIGTILIERVIDFCFLFALIFLTIILKFNDLLNFYSSIKSQNTNSTNWNTIILTLLIIAIFIATFFILKKQLKKSAFYDKILTFIDGLKEGFKSIQKIKQKSKFWFHTFSIWIMYCLMT